MTPAALRAARRRDVRRRPTRPRRWSCCCTAAARTSRRSWALAPHLPTGPTYAAVPGADRRGRRLRLVRQPRHRPPRRGVAARRPWTGSGPGSTTSPRLADRSCWSASAAAPRSPAAWCSTTRPATPGPRSSTAPCRSTPASRSTAGRLANLPVFVAQGDADHVIPRELLDRTWNYLLAESGAPTVGPASGRRPPAHRRDGPPPGGLDRSPALLDRPLWRRPGRTAGRRPLAHPDRRRASSTTRPGTGGELDDPPAATDPERTRRSPGTAVRRDPAASRCAGGPLAHLSARRPRLHPGRGFGRRGSFLVPQFAEFAHLHPAHDGSLHVALPPEQAADVSAQGWGRPHMWAGTRLSPGFTLVHGPRDDDELVTVLGIVAASHAYATGASRWCRRRRRPVARPHLRRPFVVRTGSMVPRTADPSPYRARARGATLDV